MPNVLVAVKSCAGDISAGHNQAIRNTWGARFPVPLRFFVGRGSIPISHDEVRLDVSDGYYALPQKTCAILRWAWREDGFDFIYLCDTDTYVRAELLLSSGFEDYDLMGWFGQPRAWVKDRDGYWPWPSGGGGYWLSKKAALIIAAHHEHIDWAEDRMVGQLLGPHIKAGTLRACNRPEFGGGESPSMISAHYCGRGLHRDYDPEWMLKMHAKWADVSTGEGR